MDPLEELVEQARSRSNGKAQRHAAFGSLVKQFQNSASSWAVAKLNDPLLAQDAVQESFVIAYQQLHSLREPKAFPGWLHQIVVNQCYRLVRNKQLPVHPIENSTNLPDPEPTPAATVEAAEIRDNVLAAMQALPENEQIVTKLFYFNGYSQKEIARLLEIPVTTVKKRLQYARRNLKGILVSMMDSLAPAPTPQPVPIPVRVRKRPYHPHIDDQTTRF